MATPLQLKTVAWLLTISSCVFFTGCAKDPYAGVPPAKRQAVLAEALQAQQENNNGTLTVAELLKQYNASEQALALKTPEPSTQKTVITAATIATNYRNALSFSPDEIKLNEEQAKILYELLQQLDNPKQYTANVDIGPGTSSDEFNAAIIGKQRAHSFDIALEQVLARVETTYNPSLPVGAAIVELEPVDPPHV